MVEERINIDQKFSLFADQWSPRVIAQMNEVQFKLARIEGEFVWHAHEDTDEAFIVIDGEMDLEFRDHVLTLRAGEMAIVSKGVEHKPVARTECRIMLIEPKGVINTGNTGGERTAPSDVWI
ncbi:MAG: cupin domain-containing protein [Bacteroidetes bacterium]|nr:cupin domain-containing protein [Bacteroidota bacterium]MDA1333229.1 cupin domain-containing protein [Bacteroidota bacterium]